MCNHRCLFGALLGDYLECVNIYHSLGLWKQYSKMYFVYPFEFGAVTYELIYTLYFTLSFGADNLLAFIFVQDTSLLKHTK